MKLSKEEVSVELNHKQRLVQELNKRRRVIEVQIVQQGFNAPPQLITELDSLTDQIQKHEIEIAQLETLAAEDQLSLTEAEYRVLVAETWGTPLGRPTIAGGARLELERLRLRLPPESAHEIEHDVRVKLAEEAFANLDTRLIEFLPTRSPASTATTTVLDVVSTLPFAAPQRDRVRSIAAFLSRAEAARETVRTEDIKRVLEEIVPGQDDPRNVALCSIGRAIRLDLPTALRLSLSVLPTGFPLDVVLFGEALLAANRVWNYQEDHTLFQEFLTTLSESLEAKTSVIQH